MKYNKFKTYFLAIIIIIGGILIYLSDPSEFDDGRIYHIPIFLLLSIFGKTGTFIIIVLSGISVIIYQAIKEKALLRKDMKEAKEDDTKV